MVSRGINSSVFTNLLYQNIKVATHWPPPIAGHFCLAARGSVDYSMRNVAR